MDAVVECPNRQRIARLLLETEDCCLVKPTTDFALKMKHAYFNDFKVMATHGTCSGGLFMCMLMVRAKLPSQNQDLEGMMSILQKMGKAAPHMGQALASDRMCMKKSDEHSAAELAGIHELVEAEMSSQNHHFRFAPLMLTPYMGKRVPTEMSLSPCKHKMQPRLLQAGRLALGCVQQLGKVIDAQGLFSFESLKRPGSAASSGIDAFIFDWSYGYKMFCITGKASFVGSVPIFELGLPMDPEQLISLIEDLDETVLPPLPEPPKPGEKRKRGSKDPELQLFWYPILWNLKSCTQATVDVDEKSTYTIKPAKPPQKRKKNIKTAFGPSTLPMQDLGAVDAVDAVDEVEEDEEDAELEGDDLGMELAAMIDDDYAVLQEGDEDQEDDQDEWLAGLAAEVPEVIEASTCLTLEGDLELDEDDELQDGSEDQIADAEAVGVIAAVATHGCKPLEAEVVAESHRMRLHLKTSLETLEASNSTATIFDRVISLIRYKPAGGSGSGNEFVDEHMFVRWSNVTSMQAHQVSLDRENRIKSIVFGVMPKLDCNMSEIVIKDTGVQLARERGVLRTSMPDWCVSVAAWCSCKVFAGPAEHSLEFSSSALCIVCSALPEHGKTFMKHARGKAAKAMALGGLSDISPSSLFRCAGCLAYWHKNCIELYVGGLEEITAPFVCPCCFHAGVTM